MKPESIRSRAIACATFLLCVSAAALLATSVLAHANGFRVALPGVALHPALAAPAAKAATYMRFAAQAPMTWSEQKVSAADGAAGDDFSYAVSVSGSTAVIGAPYAGVAGNGQGIAYVYTEANGLWTLQQTLVADDAGAGDAFGFSVSVSGDTLVIGAPYANLSEGAMYVFTRSGDSWSQAQKLEPRDGASNYN